MKNAIYYLIITWYGDEEPVEQREFWNIDKAFQIAKEYEKLKNWRRIEIFESTTRTKGEEIQPDKLYYIRTN